MKWTGCDMSSNVSFRIIVLTGSGSWQGKERQEGQIWQEKEEEEEWQERKEGQEGEGSDSWQVYKKLKYKID